MSCGCALWLLALPAWAETHPNIDRQSLLKLADKFVNQLGKNLQEADDYLSGLDPRDIRLQKFFEGIEDGEPLVLQITLIKNDAKKGDRPRQLEQPITAIKQGKDVMISLYDFVSVAGFPIKIDPDRKTAEGWFIREDQIFSLNGPARTALINGKPFVMTEEDLVLEESDVLVRGKLLGEWFNFNIYTNLQSQKAEIVTQQSWPVQEKIDRINRQKGKFGRPKPEQPYQETAYKAFTPPRADISITQTLAKSEDGDSGAPEAG